MTPLEQRVKNLEEVIERISRCEDVAFIKSIERNTTFVTEAQLAALKLSDLSDVSDTDGASTGQVLKKTATTWQPGTDNV